MADTENSEKSLGVVHIERNDVDLVVCRSNGLGSINFEYDAPKPFDGAYESRITDSYPYRHYVTNKMCDESIYVAEGTGTLDVVNTPSNDSGRATLTYYTLKTGDYVIIHKNTIFRYNINNMEGLRLFVIAQPKFSIEQHVVVDMLGNTVSPLR